MAYKTDIEIAQETKLVPINEIAASLGIPDEAVENYGRYKAKIDIGALKGLPEKAKLICGRSERKPSSPCGNRLSGPSSA